MPTPTVTPEIDDLLEPSQAPIALIIRPENQKPKRNGPLRLPVMVQRKGPGGKAATAHMVQGDFLAPGTQFVTPEIYEAMQSHPFWSALVKANVIEVVGSGSVVSDGKPGLTCAYSNESDAFRLISNTLDLEWLEDSKHREDRRSVNSAIRDRITELQNDMIPKQEGER